MERTRTKHVQVLLATAVLQEEVEIVRATFAAFRERDFDAVASLLHPDLEVRPAIAGGPEGVVYHGPEGMREFWNEIDAAWAEFRIEPQEFLDLVPATDVDFSTLWVRKSTRVPPRGAGRGAAAAAEPASKPVAREAATPALRVPSR